MRYVPPFSSLNKNLIFGTEQGKPWVKMTYEDFENLLRQLLQAVKVDEEWYRSHYPDVDQAIQDGTMQSAHDHFVTSGYFEGRLPCEIEVNEECVFSSPSRYRRSGEGWKDYFRPTAFHRIWLCRRTSASAFESGCLIHTLRCNGDTKLRS